jgi:hypothetical protein
VANGVPSAAIPIAVTEPLSASSLLISPKLEQPTTRTAGRRS